MKYAEVASIVSVLSETKKRDDKEINMSLSILKDHLTRIDELMDKSREEPLQLSFFCLQKKRREAFFARASSKKFENMKISFITKIDYYYGV